MSDGMDDDLGRKAMTLSTDNLTLRLREKPVTTLLTRSLPMA